MSARPYRWHWLWFATLGAGCTSGLAEPIVIANLSASGAAGSGGSADVADAGRSEGKSDADPNEGLSDAGRKAGSGGVSGSAGRTGQPGWNAGAGGTSAFCPEGDPGPATLDQEQQLFTLINSAIADGSLCLDRPLVLKDELSCGARRYARALAADSRSGGNSTFFLPDGWGPIVDTSGDGWRWGKRHIATAQDAKKTMIDEKSDFCDSSLHLTYKSVGVGQSGDAWAIVLMNE